MVRLPDAAGQLKNAPVRVLRGFFAGIGQLLLAADRFRAEEAERERAGRDEQSGPATPASRALADDQARAAGTASAEETEPAGAQASPAGSPPREKPRKAKPARAQSAGGKSARAQSAGGKSAGALASDDSHAGPAAKGTQPDGPARFRSLDSTGNVRLLTPDEAAASPGEARPRSATGAELSHGRSPAQRAADPAARGTEPEAASSSVRKAAASPLPEAAPGPGQQVSSSRRQKSVSGPGKGPTSRQASMPKRKGIAEDKTAADGNSSANHPADPAHVITPARTAQPAASADLPVPGYDGLSLPSMRARLRGLDLAQLRILLDHERSSAKRTDVMTMFERRIAKLEAAARDAT